MPYAMRSQQASVLFPGKYKSPDGRTECVAFVRQETSAPPTYLWHRGLHVQSSSIGAIVSGTTIATFDSGGKYPTDTLGKHAATYLGHSAAGIDVLDQWARQGSVKRRTIRFSNNGASSRSDQGETFYVIE